MPRGHDQARWVALRRAEAKTSSRGMVEKRWLGRRGRAHLDGGEGGQPPRVERRATLGQGIRREAHVHASALVASVLIDPGHFAQVRVHRRQVVVLEVVLDQHLPVWRSVSNRSCGARRRARGAGRRRGTRCDVAATQPPRANRGEFCVARNGRLPTLERLGARGGTASTDAPHSLPGVPLGHTHCWARTFQLHSMSYVLRRTA